MPEPDANQQRAANAAALVAPTMLPMTRLGPALGLRRFRYREVWAWYEPPPTRGQYLRGLRKELAATTGRFEPHREARHARLWPFGQLFVHQGRETARLQRPQPGSKWSLEIEADAHTRHQRERALPDSRWQQIVLAILLGISVVPGVLSALLLRGGVRNLLFGIDVVRGDGRPAGRLRCAWRATVAWVPLVVPLFLARWVEEHYWSQWTPQGGPTWMLWTADVCWLLAIVLPAACLVLILRTPARSLHDRLSGTWLVPR